MTIPSRHWIEPQVESPAAKLLAFSGLWSRATHWIVATAKRVLPVIAVFAVFAAVLAATIALRLAIWLPLHFHP